MASEESSTHKLPLYAPSPKLSPELSGLSSPPFETSASIPFLWEEEPGKPRPCTSIITLPTHTKCLKLPPRLQSMEFTRSITKTASPTTVLDGPYVGKDASFSSSFRIFNGRKSPYSSDNSFSPERVHSCALLLGDTKGKKGLFGNSWGQMQVYFQRKGCKGEFAAEGSSAISPSEDNMSAFGKEDVDKSGTFTKVKNIFRRNGSFSGLSHAKSHFWTAMCKEIKNAMPWKSRKSKQQVYIV